MLTNPIDLLLRPPEASLPEVVAALRDIYHCKPLDAPPPSAARLPPLEAALSAAAALRITGSMRP